MSPKNLEISISDSYVFENSGRQRRIRDSFQGMQTVFERESKPAHGQGAGLSVSIESFFHVLLPITTAHLTQEFKAEGRTDKRQQSANALCASQASSLSY